jgi:Cilia BBSome complex subunit 10
MGYVPGGFLPSDWLTAGSIFTFSPPPPLAVIIVTTTLNINTTVTNSYHKVVGIVHGLIMVERGQRFPDLIEPVLPRRGLVYQESNPQLVLCKVS